MKIGIIGGVSPEAYSTFYNSLCLKYREITNYYPSIISYSVKVSMNHEIQFFKNNLENDSLMYIESELDMACKIFSNNNVEIVTICCNTLSDIFYKIASKYNFKYILTPIASVNNYLIERSKPALLLGTSYTLDNNLYNNIVKPNSTDQNQIDEFIYDKVNERKPSININEIISRYDVKTVILGCTDIKNTDINNNIKIIDSAECLLKDCIKYMVN